MTPRVVAGHTVIEGTITAQTEKALCIQIDTVDNEPIDSHQKTYWIPISQTHSHFESGNKGEDWILITDWIAKKIGLV